MTKNSQCNDLLNTCTWRMARPEFLTYRPQVVIVAGLDMVVRETETGWGRKMMSAGFTAFHEVTEQVEMPGLRGAVLET